MISLSRVHSHKNTNFNKTANSRYLDELQKMTTPQLKAETFFYHVYFSDFLLVLFLLQIIEVL